MKVWRPNPRATMLAGNDARGQRWLDPGKGAEGQGLPLAGVRFEVARKLLAGRGRHAAAVEPVGLAGGHDSLVVDPADENPRSLCVLEANADRDALDVDVAQELAAGESPMARDADLRPLPLDEIGIEDAAKVGPAIGGGDRRELAGWHCLTDRRLVAEAPAVDALRNRIDRELVLELAPGD